MARRSGFGVDGPSVEGRWCMDMGTYFSMYLYIVFCVVYHTLPP